MSEAGCDHPRIVPLGDRVGCPACGWEGTDTARSDVNVLMPPEKAQAIMYGARMRVALLLFDSTYEGNCPQCGEKYHRHAADLCTLADLVEKIR